MAEETAGKARAAFDPSLFALLVVDDEEMNRDMLSRRLERKGYFTMMVPGGAEAIEKINTAGCDLVLLDIMMPGLSGFDTLKLIRERYAPEELPVIMASARTDTEAITQCLNGGANDYITKPLDFPVVLARVQTQLTMKAAVESLRKTEARFRVLADASPDIISLHGADGRFRFVSNATMPILGFASAELESKSLIDLMHPEDRAALPALVDLPESCTLIVRLQRKDGGWTWAEIRMRLVRGNRTGKVTDIQCSTRDVSASVFGRAAAPLITPTGPSVAAPLASPSPVAPMRTFDPAMPASDEPPVRRRPSGVR
jgi:PAS domain S-box-containing protein